MFQIFARPKPCKIMMILRDGESTWHLSKIAKSSDTSYVYVTHLMTELQNLGLIILEAKGKKKVVKLTDRGMAIANAINELKTKTEI